MSPPSLHVFHIHYISRVILLGIFDPANEANEAVPEGSRSGDRDSGSYERQLGQQGKHLSYCTVST